MLEECSSMYCLPKELFEARRATEAGPNSLSLVRFDHNSYTVPVNFAHHKIAMMATVEEVRLSFEDHQLAQHTRHLWRGSRHLQPRALTGTFRA